MIDLPPAVEPENALAGPIAYLTGEYPRATDTFIQREVAALRDLGFTVETCSIRRTGPEHLTGPEQRSEAAATFYVIEAMRRPLVSLRAHARALRHPGRYLRALRLAWQTAPLGLRGRIFNLIYFAEAVVLAARMQDRGIVHLHNHIAKASCTVAMIASDISGIPYSFTLHGPDIFYEPYHWRLDEKIARAAFVACISEFCRSQAMVFSDPAHWGKLHIVHCGVDPARYDAPPRRAGGQLLFLGRLAAIKGVPVLFEALAKVRGSEAPLRLVLIGDGPERATLVEMAARLGISDQVHFAGYKSQADVAAALQAADVLVLPSFAEGLPVVLMEAMAARLPVIATQIAGVPELVRPGVNGWLVPPGDVDDLADAIREATSDPARARAMGEAGRRVVERDFNAATEAATLAILILSSRTGGPRPAKRPGASR
jgi:glycosyltransferase involved in cell wall biosynthesis